MQIQVSTNTGPLPCVPVQCFCRGSDSGVKRAVEGSIPNASAQLQNGLHNCAAPATGRHGWSTPPKKKKNQLLDSTLSVLIDIVWS